MPTPTAVEMGVALVATLIFDNLISNAPNNWTTPPSLFARCGITR